MRSARIVVPRALSGCVEDALAQLTRRLDGLDDKGKGEPGKAYLSQVAATERAPCEVDFETGPFRVV